MGIAYDLNALSGINAASNGLAVISNNLANSQSVAFKSSRAEFADMFAGSQKSPGSGVRVAAITQDFSQGTITGTGRELDMAIDGEGFFVVEDRTGKYENVYTRNGSFKLDSEGYLTTQEGNMVQGYGRDLSLSNEGETVFQTTLGPIELDELNKKPKVTDEIKYDINLKGDADNNLDPTVTDLDVASVGSTANLLALVDPENAAPAFNGSPDFVTTTTIYDSLGGEHRLTSSYYKRDVVTDVNSATVDANGNPIKYTSWIAQFTVQDFNEDSGEWETSGRQATGHGVAPGTPDATDGTAAVPGAMAGMVFELRFDSDGALTEVRTPDDPQAPTGVDDSNTNPGQDLNAWTVSSLTPSMSWIIDTPLIGATDPLGKVNADNNVQIAIDFSEMTQFSGSYNLRGVTQNGYSVGDLVGISTNSNGVIEARYSNGNSVQVAKLGIANFADLNAMEKLGGQTYAATFGSGPVQLGTPENNGFGSIASGSLEYSNVDIAGELVNMIQMQRTYQASAQVISTSQQLTQTILQL